MSTIKGGHILPSCIILGTADTVQRMERNPAGISHCREEERDGRCCVKGDLRSNEWSLTMGRPLIDLFATIQNAKLRVFYTRWFHQRHQTDALLLQWDYTVAYAFPPVCLLSQVIQKIRLSRGQVLLIVPFCSIEAVVQVVASTTIGLPSDPIGHT